VSHRLKLFAASPIAAFLLLVGVTTAFAASTVTVYPYGALVSPTQAVLAAQITCTPDTLQPNLTIRLVQSSGSGTGSASAIVCDSQPHYYLIPVTATTGTFQPGTATAYVEWSYKTCTTSTTGPPKCVGNASVRHQTITLYQVPPSNQG
jgi:hypothetical protein